MKSWGSLLSLEKRWVAQIEYIFLSNVSASQQGQDWSILGVPTQLDNSESLFVKH